MLVFVINALLTFHPRNQSNFLEISLLGNNVFQVWQDAVSSVSGFTSDIKIHEFLVSRVVASSFKLVNFDRSQFQSIR